MPRESRAMKMVRFIVLGIMMLSTFYAPPGAGASDGTSLGAVNHFSGVGDSAMSVTIPSDSTLISDKAAEDAGLSSTGRHAALWIVRKVGPDLFDEAFVFRRTFRGCTILAPDALTSDDCTDGGEIESSLRGEEDDNHELVLPAGSYIVALSAEPESVVTGTLKIRGLTGERSFEVPSAPEYRSIWIEQQTGQPSSTPQMKGGILRGAATGHLVGDGIVSILDLWRADFGRFRQEFRCIDVLGPSTWHPDPPTWGEDGFCNTEWSMGRSKGDETPFVQAGRAHNSYCYYPDPRCPPGEIRLGFQLEVEALDLLTGAVGYLMPFGRSVSTP